jgi:Zn-dependent metalloprotease
MKLNQLFAVALLLAPISYANAGTEHAEEVTFIENNKRLPDSEWQAELRNSSVWSDFVARNGTWYVEFNEENHLPHRAYGRPIPSFGATPEQRALNFLAQELSGFGVDASELVMLSAPTTSKHVFVHFAQRTQNLAVLGSRFMVKMDWSGNVISFGMDIYDMAELSTIPAIIAADAESTARIGLSGFVSSSITGTAALPFPVYRSFEARLVYEVEVLTQNAELPGHYYCLVDANTGALLYRTNKVMNHDHAKCAAHGNTPPVSADVALTATVYEEQPYIAPTVQPLAHAEVTINGNVFNTDANGMLNSGITGPVSANFRLEGDWSTVRTGGVTPQFTMMLNDGPNAVSFDNDANIRELSAYFHVNIVHDHVKAVLPTFTGMDFSLPTNVDVGGNCNAFYDGSSINFYAEGNDCHSWAQLGEVVYHEYGHGINDNFYQSLGSSFNNGAMNEGYADIWALTITQDPVLAEGNSLTDPNDYIRRYDVNPKVYPADISGSVHADGEIIAGAWWDTYLLLGNNLPLTLQLFADAYPGLQATAFNGNEGVAYRDVLIDVLEADDVDNDITNGTPNGNMIVEAFAIHGITLLSNATIDHMPIETSVENSNILIDAELNLSFPFTNYLNSVSMFYRINNSSTWNSVLMNNTMGNNYEATIPGQPIGTVIAYYMGVSDIFGQLSAVTPVGASKPTEPNLPNYILVDFDLKLTEDLDNVNELGNWSIGLPGDDATTGNWQWDIPLGSYSTPGDPNTIVQTNDQHTPGGEFCFVTGNASSLSAGIGENDVDNGTTTLLSDPIDISGYVNPTVTYYRWFTNNAGALPNEDYWQVAITDDGVNWVEVEATRTSDRSWRRFAFRVNDYVNATADFQIKFNASDSAAFGGSLVEAAVDDIQIWDNADAQSLGELDPVSVSTLYPDPADDLLNVKLNISQASKIDIQVLDMTGRLATIANVGGAAKDFTYQLDVSQLRAGQYLLNVLWDGGRTQVPFIVAR